mgnify:FL=1
MTRAFISVPLPEVVRASFLDLDRTQQGISWSNPEQWHITIQFFEDVDIEKVKNLFSGMNAHKALAVIGPEVARLGKEVLVVPVDGLSDLVEEVRATMSTESSVEALPYVGHITLGRIKKNLDAELEGRSVEGSFQVNRLLLVESYPTPSGHTHCVIGSQSLR